MKSILGTVLLGFILLLSGSMTYADPEPAWYTQGEGKQVLINVDLFLTSTCPHCQKADAFFNEVAKKNPWLVIHRHVINEDKAALQTFYDRLQQQHLNNFSVPAIFFCDSHWTGFAEADTTGKVLLPALEYCHKKISQEGQLSKATINVMQKWGKASQVEIGASTERSATLLITIAALTDAFSPCSLFMFAAFLAFLWLYPANRRLQAAVGIVFLLSLGGIHYIQQVHAAFYYQIIAKLKWAEILVGLLLFFGVASTIRYKLIPRFTMSAGPLFFSLIIMTVFAVQIYQQTCVFNVALILEQWLAEQSYSPAKHLVYILMYQFIYLLPLAIFLVWYLLRKNKKRIGSDRTTLKDAACFILMSIGAILVIYPFGLASLATSIAVLMMALLGGWMLAKRDI